MTWRPVGLPGSVLIDSRRFGRYDALVIENTWPAQPGTYVLLLTAQSPLALAVGSLGRCAFPAGPYAYVGSARGPGGLRARLERHLRPAKLVRWHIDYLTACWPVSAVLAGPDPSSRECAWVRSLLAQPGASVPVPGFGSSDCRAACPAHLVLLPAGWSALDVRERLKP